MELVQHAPPDLRLAEPPGFHEGQFDFLTQPFPANPRQERHQRGRGGESGTGSIHQRDISRAPRLDHSRNSATTVTAVFERVDPVVLDPANHAIDPAEACESFQEQTPFAHREIRRFHEGKSEQSGFVCVLEIRRMAVSRSEENDVRHLAARGSQRLERAAFQIEKMAEPGNPQCLERLRQQIRGDIPVFQNLPQPARCRAGVIAQNRPRPAGRADQIATGSNEEMPAERLHPARILKESGTGMHQIRRNKSFTQKLLRAINIREYHIDQADPLGQSGRNMRPIIRWNQQRDGIEFIRLPCPADIAVNVESRAQILDHPDSGGGNRIPILRAPAQDFPAQSLPMRPDQPAGIDHFVPNKTTARRSRRLRGQ